jgi:hypothetical protein
VLERTNAGCNFLATVTPNSQLGSSFAYGVVLVNTQSYTVDVTISGGAMMSPIMRTVPASGTLTVPLPWVPELAQFDGTYAGCPSATSAACRMSPLARSVLRRGGAYRIVATSPIVVHQLNPVLPQAAGNVALTGDGATLFPSHALGTEHTVLTFAGNAARRREARAFFAITATSNDTTVTVRSTAPLVAGAGVTAVAVDGTPTYMLGEGDVLLFVAETSTDPSGTTISSNRPVAVITGRDCATSAPGSVECDHLEEALPPNETAGRDYVVALPRETREATAVVRVMSLTAGTMVSYTPMTVRAPEVLGLRQVVEFSIPSSVRVVSSRAVMVAQSRDPTMMDAGGVALGDPTMVFEAPVRQWRTTSPFLVPAMYVSTFATVVVPPGSNPALDTSPLMGAPELVTGYAIYTVPLSAGRHRIAAASGAPSSGNESFVKVHGSAPYVSFAYPASTELRAINTD